MGSEIAGQAAFKPAHDDIMLDIEDVIKPVSNGRGDMRWRHTTYVSPRNKKERERCPTLYNASNIATVVVNENGNGSSERLIFGHLRQPLRVSLVKYSPRSDYGRNGQSLAKSFQQVLEREITLYLSWVFARLAYTAAGDISAFCLTVDPKLCEVMIESLLAEVEMARQCSA